jgi:hypothetical protein
MGLKLPTGHCHSLYFKHTLCGQNMRNDSHDFVNLGDCDCEEHFCWYTVICALRYGQCFCHHSVCMVSSQDIGLEGGTEQHTCSRLIGIM